MFQNAGPPTRNLRARAPSSTLFGYMPRSGHCRQYDDESSLVAAVDNIGCSYANPFRASGSVDQQIIGARVRSCGLRFVACMSVTVSAEQLNTEIPGRPDDLPGAGDVERLIARLLVRWPALSNEEPECLIDGLVHFFLVGPEVGGNSVVPTVLREITKKV